MAEYTTKVGNKAKTGLAKLALYKAKALYLVPTLHDPIYLHMKANKSITLLSLLFLLQGVACTPCATMRPDPPAPVSFYLVDASGNNPFSIPETGIHPDSLQLTLDNEPFNYLFTGMDESLGNMVFETYPVIYNKSRVRMLLRLNSLNTDTLDISYTVSRSKCYTDYTYSAFYFNGKELKRHPETGYLQLQVL